MVPLGLHHCSPVTSDLGTEDYTRVCLLLLCCGILMTLLLRGSTGVMLLWQNRTTRSAADASRSTYEILLLKSLGRT